MIRRVHYANFRALRDVWLELEPFTVLVGPNASGKSSAFDALDPTRKLAKADRSDVRVVSKLTIEMEDGRTLERTLASPLPRTQVVHFDLAQMRVPRKIAAAAQLERHGGNLVNALYALPRASQSRVAEQLSRLVQVVRDVELRAGPGEGEHHLEFEDRWSPGTWYDATRVSDGTIYALAYLTLQHHPSPPEVLCVEEPERSLHPYLIGQVVDTLRRMTTGELGGHKTQVIVATQSAEVLEHVEASEVRFFSRDEAGAVQIRRAPTDEPGWDDAVREYAGSVGQMWLSGGLGGVPAL